MSLTWGLDELIAVHLRGGVLGSDKAQLALDTCNNMDETHVHCAKWKKPDPKAAYCMILST